MDDEGKITGDSDPEDIITILENNMDTLAYGIDSKTRAYQCHYTIVKTAYKKLACTWMIATFIGYSFFLKGSAEQLHLNNDLTIFFLSILATIGIYLLYFLDIRIYQQLTEAIFIESERLENKFPFLGNTNKNIVHLLVKKSVYPLIYEVLFYAVLTSSLLMVGDLFLFFYLKEISLKLAIITFISSFILILLFEIRVICRMSILQMSKKVIDSFKS